MGRDKPTVYVYTTTKQKTRWESEAEKRNMSMSEFVSGMTEAGLKKFDTTVDPDETRTDLREQRNDLKEQLENARNRIQTLENRLHYGERAEIQQYIEENPGVTFDEVVRHVIDTVPARVSQHIDDLEGDLLVIDSEPETETYYPAGKQDITDDLP